MPTASEASEAPPSPTLPFTGPALPLSRPGKEVDMLAVHLAELTSTSGPSLQLAVSLNFCARCEPAPSSSQNVQLHVSLEAAGAQVGGGMMSWCAGSGCPHVPSTSPAARPRPCSFAGLFHACPNLLTVPHLVFVEHHGR